MRMKDNVLADSKQQDLTERPNLKVEFSDLFKTSGLEMIEVDRELIRMTNVCLDSRESAVNLRANNLT
jgi:hypothetical protein